MFNILRVVISVSVSLKIQQYYYLQIYIFFHLISSLVLIRNMVYSNGLDVFNIQTVRVVFQFMIIVYLSISSGLFVDEMTRYLYILPKNQE